MKTIEKIMLLTHLNLNDNLDSINLQNDTLYFTGKLPAGKDPAHKVYRMVTIWYLSRRIRFMRIFMQIYTE